MKIPWAWLLLLAAFLAGCSRPEVAASPAQPASAQGAGGLYQDAGIFDAVRAVMGTASGRIWVEMYEFGRQDLADTMAGARARGLDVRLVYDPSVGVSRGLAARLRRSGVEARGYPLDDRRHQIDHVKLLLTESGAVVGGMNWGARSAGNHDYALELHDPALLSGLAGMFERDWELAGPEPTAAGPAGLVGSTADGSVTAVETAPGQGVREALLQALGAARQRVWAEVFVLTDGEVLAALGAAARRGLEVEVLLDPNQEVNRASYRLLQQSRVQVRWYPVPRGAKLHAKAGLFDARLLVGSANWSWSGLSVNHELDLVVQEAAAAAAFRARFGADWARAG